MNAPTDGHLLEESSERIVAKVAPSSRTLPLVAQVAGISVLFAVALFGYAWWQTGSVELVRPWLGGERLLFEPTRVVLGDVPKSEIIERQLRVVNLSSHPLTLLGSQPSCGCISLDDFPIVVPPGKEHHLKLKIGTSASSGSFEHHIKFFSDERGYTSVVVTISGSVH